MAIAWPRENKYGAKKASCRKAHRHDSVKEARRCEDLHLLQAGDRIRALVVHKRYRLEVNEEKIADYECDFNYWEVKDQGEPKREVWEEVVEDCKGVKTAVYRLKKKLMHAIYGIEIRET